MHTLSPGVTLEVEPACRLIASQLAQQGWCIYPAFLPDNLVQDLRLQAQAAWHAGRFRHAGIGRGKHFEIKPQIRNDQVLWLEPAQCEGALTSYFTALETLRQTINHAVFLGLYDFEAHLAVYPAGSFYTKHLDQFRGVGLRTLTTTFYLNEDWQPWHGGQLRLYTDQHDPAHFIDILPKAGTLVSFLSADYLHEVLPATRERLSITGWFRRREV